MVSLPAAWALRLMASSPSTAVPARAAEVLRKSRRVVARPGVLESEASLGLKHARRAL